MAVEIFGLPDGVELDYGSTLKRGAEWHEVQVTAAGSWCENVVSLGRSPRSSNSHQPVKVVSCQKGKTQMNDAKANQIIHLLQAILAKLGDAVGIPTA